MLKEHNLYKCPIGLPGKITPGNLQIWGTRKENTQLDDFGYTLVYITKEGHKLPLIRPYKFVSRVNFIRDELLNYFHNPLEHHTKEEVEQVRNILNNSLAMIDAHRPVMNALGITQKKARALIAKILNPDIYNPFIYGIVSIYRGFDFYNKRIWKTGILPPLRKPKYELINRITNQKSK